MLVREDENAQLMILKKDTVTVKCFHVFLSVFTSLKSQNESFGNRVQSPITLI